MIWTAVHVTLLVLPYVLTSMYAVKVIKRLTRIAYLRGNGDGFVEACDDIGTCIRRAEQIQHLHEAMGDTMTASDFRLMLLDQLEVMYADPLATVKEVSS